MNLKKERDILDHLQEEEEHEEELMYGHSHVEHHVKGIAHAWDVDMNEVRCISDQISQSHEQRVEELHELIREGKYSPDSASIAHSLIIGESTAHKL